MKNQSCKTCKWSRWYLTPAGRIKKDSIGQCLVPMPVMPPLPDCITKVYGYQSLLPRVCVHPDDDAGENCPLFEKNEGKPIANVY